jgi:hypothetical protein
MTGQLLLSHKADKQPLTIVHLDKKACSCSQAVAYCLIRLDGLGKVAATPVIVIVRTKLNKVLNK